MEQVVPKVNIHLVEDLSLIQCEYIDRMHADAINMFCVNLPRCGHATNT